MNGTKNAHYLLQPMSRQKDGGLLRGKLKEYVTLLSKFYRPFHAGAEQALVLGLERLEIAKKNG